MVEQVEEEVGEGGLRWKADEVWAARRLTAKRLVPGARRLVGKVELVVGMEECCLRMGFGGGLVGALAVSALLLCGSVAGAGEVLVRAAFGATQDGSVMLKLVARGKGESGAAAAEAVHAVIQEG